MVEAAVCRRCCCCAVRQSLFRERWASSPPTWVSAPSARTRRRAPPGRGTAARRDRSLRRVGCARRAGAERRRHPAQSGRGGDRDHRGRPAVSAHGLGHRRLAPRWPGRRPHRRPPLAVTGAQGVEAGRRRATRGAGGAGVYASVRGVTGASTVDDQRGQLPPQGRPTEPDGPRAPEGHALMGMQAGSLYLSE